MNYNFCFKRYWMLLIQTILLFSVVTSIVAEPLPDAYHFRRTWLNVALGVAGNRDYGGVGGEISGNLRVSRNWLLTARLNRVTASPVIISRSIACALSGVVNCTADQNYEGDAGLLFGYIFHGTSGYTSVSAGAAYVKGRNTGGRESFETAGFPVETQTFWTPTGYVGLGLIVFADINNIRSYTGALLALQLGSHQANTPPGDD